LLVAGLFWEKSTVGWWLISQANRAVEPVPNATKSRLILIPRRRGRDDTWCINSYSDDAGCPERGWGKPVGRAAWGTDAETRRHPPICSNNCDSFGWVGHATRPAPYRGCFPSSPTSQCLSQVPKHSLKSPTWISFIGLKLSAHHGL
jgi:hypothetical protein